MRETVEELIIRYEKEMKSTTCTTLKDNFRTEEDGCKGIILKAAEILDDIIQREMKN